ncbi:MAG: hypothetical protein ABH950_00475, partial [Candidatus Altiarchaeota archaeon]
VKRKYGSTIYSRTHRTKKNELLLKLINYNLHKTTKIETLIQGFLQSQLLKNPHGFSCIKPSFSILEGAE